MIFLFSPLQLCHAPRFNIGFVREFGRNQEREDRKGGRIRQIERENNKNRERTGKSKGNEREIRVERETKIQLSFHNDFCTALVVLYSYFS